MIVNQNKTKIFIEGHAKFMQNFIKTIVSLAFMLDTDLYQKPTLLDIYISTLNTRVLITRHHFWLAIPSPIEMLSGEMFAVKHYELSLLPFSG